MRKLDVFMLTCAFVLVANVCYFEGKHSADKWWNQNPTQSRCVVTQPDGIVIWGDCKLDCLKRVFTKHPDGSVTAQCFCNPEPKSGPAAWSEITGASEPGKPIEWHHEKPKVKIINCDKALFCFNDGVPAKSSWTLLRVMIDYENHIVSSICPEKELQIEPLPFRPFDDPYSPMPPPLVKECNHEFVNCEGPIISTNHKHCYDAAPITGCSAETQ